MMDYSKKKIMFDEAAAQKQMANAFGKNRNESEKEVKLSPDFEVPSAKQQYSRKTPVTYTVHPDIKTGIDQLAKKQGFRSTSAFVEKILEQVIQQSK